MYGGLSGGSSRPHPAFPFLLCSADIWPSMGVQVRRTRNAFSCIHLSSFLFLVFRRLVFEGKKTGQKIDWKIIAKSLGCQIHAVSLDLMKQSNLIHVWLQQNTALSLSLSLLIFNVSTNQFRNDRRYHQQIKKPGQKDRVAILVHLLALHNTRTWMANQGT